MVKHLARVEQVIVICAIILSLLVILATVAIKLIYLVLVIFNLLDDLIIMAPI